MKLYFSVTTMLILLLVSEFSRTYSRNTKSCFDDFFLISIDGDASRTSFNHSTFTTASRSVSSLTLIKSGAICLGDSKKFDLAISGRPFFCAGSRNSAFSHIQSQTTILLPAFSSNAPATIVQSRANILRTSALSI